jgi:geranylgeranyl diphosphate synthase type II
VKLSSFMPEIQTVVHEELARIISSLKAPPLLKEAMNYSLLAGGKRIRPVFLAATIHSLGHDWRTGIAAACAVEMIHTYSLIHDDLPAMDDDDYRRGQLTNHKKYGEAMAILAGDALLTHAFHVLARDHHLSTELRIEALQELSDYAGAQGMVGGQVLDLLGEKKALTLDELYAVHQHKTADLLTCSIRIGAHIGHASVAQLEQLSIFGKQIGLAFQIQDDILDEIGDQSKTGKKAGSDRQNEKNTFVSQLGLEGARQKLHAHTVLAREALRRADVSGNLLEDLTDYMITRDR